MILVAIFKWGLVHHDMSFNAQVFFEKLLPVDLKHSLEHVHKGKLLGLRFLLCKLVVLIWCHLFIAAKLDDLAFGALFFGVEIQSELKVILLVVSVNALDALHLEILIVLDLVGGFYHARHEPILVQNEHAGLGRVLFLLFFRVGFLYK